MPFFAHSDRQRAAEESSARNLRFLRTEDLSDSSKNKDNLMVRIETDGDTFKYGKETPCAFVDAPVRPPHRRRRRKPLPKPWARSCKRRRSSVRAKST